MTTTAQVLPALEVSAPDDDMDVLSDTGFDFGDGDGDIDLDLEPDTALSVHDDDMSLNDAATDGGLDMQELPVDQDDFMADNGDLIEEDDVYEGQDTTEAISQTVDDGIAIVEADMLAPPDEDLIDYSDDEAQQPVKMQSPSAHEDEAHAQVTYDIEATFVPVDDHREDVQTQEEAQSPAPTDGIQEGAQDQQDKALETLGQREASPEHQSHSPIEPQHDDGAQEHIHADDDGGVLLPADEHLHNDDDVAVTQQEDVQQAASGAHEDHKDQQIELRPVTVNYAGNELWLFKQHDLDESGDYILDDLSVAKSSISELFQACRSSLGDDVSNEHEIGFRFDHLHNLELYEDNTACVAVSLARLVDLYHTLQAQDGNEDPECFYITLEFRPRFATLLADVAQYADQGSGYSALDAAVAAGETHFSNLFSSASTEHEYVDWEDEENEDEEADSPDSVHSIAPQETEVNEPDERHSEDVDEQQNKHEEYEEGHSQEQEQHQQGVASKDDLHQAQDSEEEPYASQEAANIDPLESVPTQASMNEPEVAHEPGSEALERQTSASPDERTPDQIAHDKQEAEDFVDYSDDEDNEEVKSAPAHESSPSSSTVQGDEPAETQDSALVTAPDEQGGDDAAETGFDAEHEDDETLLTQAQYDDGANDFTFQEYTETYDQGDPFQDSQADGTVGDPFEADGTFQDDTNQEFAEYDSQTLDDEGNPGFDEQALNDPNNGDHFDETYAVVEGSTDADAFLDFDNAPEWATDAEPVSNLPEDTVLLHDDDATAHENEEGGAVDQPAATTSLAADLVLISSNDHKPSSPQGQKRSIDEVGSGVDDAPDATDAKRPRV